MWAHLGARFVRRRETSFSTCNPGNDKLLMRTHSAPREYCEPGAYLSEQKFEPQRKYFSAQLAQAISETQKKGKAYISFFRFCSDYISFHARQ